MRKRYICKVLALSFAFLVSTTVSSPAATYDLLGLIAQFDDIDRSFNNGDGYSNLTNDDGYLAWGESYLLEAYLDMYEKTGSVKYLDSFVQHADRVVNHTDLKRGIYDYRGRSTIGWSSTHYSLHGERVVWLVHTGMITYPLARFAWLVDKNKITTYMAQARTYADIAKRALAVFDDNWVGNAGTGTGYYQFFPDEPTSANAPSPPMPLPFNQQLAAGRTHIMLYLITGDKAYRARAEALARHFRSYLTKDASGSYVWNYWYGKGYKQSEDISHGAIDLDFVLLAYRNGIIFNRVDITRFLQTYTKKIRKNGTFADRVDGSGSGTYKEAVGCWLELSEFSSVAWQDFLNLFSSVNIAWAPQGKLGLAKLIKYYKAAKK